MEGESLPTVNRLVFSYVMKRDYDSLKKHNPLGDLAVVYPSLLQTVLLADCVRGEPVRSVVSALPKDGRLNIIMSIVSVDGADLLDELRRLAASKNSAGRMPSMATFETCDAMDKICMVCREMLAARKYQVLLRKRRKALPRSTSESAKRSEHTSSFDVVQWRIFDPMDSVPLFEQCCAALWVILIKLKTVIFRQDLMEALMLYKNGAEAIQRLVANTPVFFQCAVRTMVTNAPDSQWLTAVDELELKNRQRALHLLCEIDPSNVDDIIKQSTGRRSLCNFALSAALQHFAFEKLTAFLLGEFYNSDEKQPSWLTDYVSASKTSKSVGNRELVAAVLKRLFDKVQVLSRGFVSGSVMDRCQAGEMITLFTVICKILCLTNVQVDPGQIESLVCLMCIEPEKSMIGAEFISTALVTLIVLSTLPNDVISVHEVQICKWIEWLIVSEEDFEKCVHGGRRCYNELLLLLALHLDISYSEGIEELITEALDVKISIESKHMDRMRLVLTKKLFNEMFVVQKMAKLRVTSNLSAKSNGFLSIHCIIELLNCRAFSKNQVSISHWIFDQLLQCSTPIHSAVPKLIDAYVNSCLVPAGRSHSIRTPNVAISEEKIVNFFQDTMFEPGRIVHQILLMYYLLCYENAYWHNYRQIASSGYKCHEYSDVVMDNVPFVYLTRYLAERVGEYAPIYASLKSYAYVLSPFHSTCYFDSFAEQVKRFGSGKATAPTKEEVLNSARNCLENSAQSLSMLKRLTNVPARRLFYLIPEIALYARYLLDPAVPDVLLLKYKKLWEKVEYYFPKKLHVHTVSALSCDLDSGCKEPKCDLSTMGHVQLCENPLLVICCDRRVFRRVVLYGITLRMLRSYLHLLRTYMDRKMMRTLCTVLTSNRTTEEIGFYENKLRDIAMNFTVGVQVTSVQVLLESCLPRKGDNMSPEQEQFWNGSNLREIESTVCSFLHELFLSTPDLVKHVHFQGYDKALIPIAVRGIPSMHMCVHFVPEMLIYGSQKRKAFTIELLAALCEQYSIHQVQISAHICYDVLLTIIKSQPREESINFFIDIFDALLRIVRTLPTMSAEMSKLFLSLVRLCRPAYSTVDVQLELAKTTDEKTQPLVEGSKEMALLLKIQEAFSKEFVRSALPVDC